MTLTPVLLLAAGGAASGQSSALEGAAPIPPPSVVRARIAETRVLGTANCSPDPEAVCIDVLIEARPEILESVAGAHVPPRPVIRYIYHIPAPRGAVGWWLVTQARPAHRYRPAVPLEVTDGSRGRELCANRDGLMWFGTLPPGGMARGDGICYPRRR
jgi:hypothetical protein